MAASVSKLSINQRAASNTGNGYLVSLDDNAEVSLLVDQHYEGIVEELLTSEPGWKFARNVAALSLLGLTPEVPWRALWQKPADALAVAYLQNDLAFRIAYEERDTTMGPALATEVYNDGSRTDFALYAVYTARVSEARFPADFAAAVQLRMEAVFLSAIAEQRQEAAQREKLAEMRLQRARIRDARSSTASDPTDWDLTRARRGAFWNVSRA